MFTMAVSVGLIPRSSIARVTGNGSGLAGPSSMQTLALKRWDNLEEKTGAGGRNTKSKRASLVVERPQMPSVDSTSRKSLCSSGQEAYRLLWR